MLHTALEVKNLSLNHLMAKTSLFVQINNSSDTSFSHAPIGFASGFFFKYEEDFFFITADHVPHYEDHKIGKRTGNGDLFAVHTNEVDKQQMAAVIAPMSGAYYFDSFDIRNMGESPKPFDLCICKLKPEQLNRDYYTQHFDFPDEPLNTGECKYAITPEFIEDPSSDDTYYILGHICTRTKGLYLQQVAVSQNNLKYISTSGDYYLLNTEEEILSDKYWSGLSGSLVYNQNGGCIGMLTSINVDSKAVWVLSFKTILTLLSYVYNQERISFSSSQK